MNMPPYLLAAPAPSLITEGYATGRAAVAAPAGADMPSRDTSPSPPRPASRLAALMMEEAAAAGQARDHRARLAPWELGQQLQASLLKYEELGNMELEVEQLQQARAVAAAQQAALQVR